MSRPSNTVVFVRPAPSGTVRWGPLDPSQFAVMIERPPLRDQRAEPPRAVIFSTTPLAPLAQLPIWRPAAGRGLPRDDERIDMGDHADDYVFLRNTTGTAVARS